MTKRTTVPVEDRLWQRVEKTATCWVWTGADVKGYGRIGLGRRGDGQIATINCIMHRCDNPPCCNPAHLWLGTRTDNHADMVQKGRNPTNGNERKTHCPQGHAYTPENVYITSIGGRRCRTCHNAPRPRRKP